MSDSNTPFSRSGTDWMVKMREVLDKDSFVTSAEGKETIRLMGLQKLARLAGITESWPELSAVDTDSGKVFQCVYRVRFSDGTLFAGAADSNRNSNDVEPFCNYPTSVAESRAEARAIRKALGITILATEEIGFAGKSRIIDAQQVVAIKNLAEKAGLNIKEVLDEVLTPAAAARISSLESLSEEQGAKLIKFLNDSRKKKGKQ